MLISFLRENIQILVLLNLGLNRISFSREEPCEMWKVVFIASNRPNAEIIKKLLEQEGLLVMLRSIGVPHTGDAGNVEILVPESEAAEAFEILSINYKDI